MRVIFPLLEGDLLHLKDSLENLYQSGESPIRAADGTDKYHLGAAAPILSQGDLMGCVMLLLGENDSPLQDSDRTLARTAASFLGMQLES